MIYLERKEGMAVRVHPLRLTEHRRVVEILRGAQGLLDRR